MELQVGVKICLINKDRKVLLLKRSKKYGEKLDGQWDFVGGRINPGINLIENLRREIKEETLLDWKNYAKLIYAQDILMPDRHVVRLTFVGKIRGNPRVKTDEENTSHKWFTFKELRNLNGKELDPYVSELLAKKILERNLRPNL